MVMEVKDVVYSSEKGRIGLICKSSSYEVLATILNNETLPRTGDKVKVCESTKNRYYGFSAVATII